MKAAAPALVLITVLAGTTACSSGQESDARTVTDSFYQAIEAGDGRQACDLMTPTTREELEQSSGQPCEVSVLKALPGHEKVLRALVYGTMAQALSTDDTAFLHRSDGHWLVVAAGCVITATGTYECQVKGS